MERFEIWFGSLFLALGLIALAIAAILYVTLSRNPRTRMIRWAFLGAPLIIGVVFVLIGAGFGGYGLWELQVERHLMANGTTTRATVTAAEQTYTRVNGRYLWRVHYQYQDQSGRTHAGSSGLLDRAEAQNWRPGEQAFIRYDPAQPSTSIWLGREDVTSGASLAGGQDAPDRSPTTG
jgi:hypothetical protein